MTWMCCTSACECCSALEVISMLSRLVGGIIDQNLQIPLAKKLQNLFFSRGYRTSNKIAFDLAFHRLTGPIRCSIGPCHVSCHVSQPLKPTIDNRNCPLYSTGLVHTGLVRYAKVLQVRASFADLLEKWGRCVDSATGTNPLLLLTLVLQQS